MVAIVILNWNGWRDTIECIKSLEKVSDEYFIVLVDNGSTDESIIHINSFLSNCPNRITKIKEGQSLNTKPENKQCIFYQLSNNYGFAKGNNLAIQLIADFKPEWILLLNNDTEVTPQFLTNLIKFSEKHNQFEILSPLIYYYFEKEIIWNAGGKINWGIRRYHYAGLKKNDIKETEYINCTFITGCALLFKSKLLENNRIFTENFFHGEEDFDLSLRMNEQKIPMACVLNSTIYHKVNRATSGMDNTGKIFVHYLNRFINNRHHMNSINYFLWKKVSLCAVFALLVIRNKFGLKQALIFCHKLSILSKKKDSVTKDDFFHYLKSGI